MKNQIKISCCLLVTVLLVSVSKVHSQTVNVGDFTIRNGTVISTIDNINNTSTGDILNDGEVIVYKDFNNDGLVRFTYGQPTGKILFNGFLGSQKISGNSDIAANDLEFNNYSANPSYFLSNNLSVYGTAKFNKGLVDNLNYNGLFTFDSYATCVNMSNDSYVMGGVKKLGNREFTYPVGDAGFFRPCETGSSQSSDNGYLSKYFFNDPSLVYSFNNLPQNVLFADNKEYWMVERKNGNEPVLITLSWNEDTTPLEILSGDTNNIHIIHWDAEKLEWIDLGGLVDNVNSTVTTISKVSDFGVFTLAKVTSNNVNKDIKVYNALTPNGDGVNDYLIFEGLDLFPNNHVYIYNRWGVGVFETTGYNTKGNVFKGYDNNGNKTVKLPVGTYFYIVEFKDNMNVMRSKTGYIYLNY